MILKKGTYFKICKYFLISPTFSTLTRKTLMFGFFLSMQERNRCERKGASEPLRANQRRSRLMRALGANLVLNKRENTIRRSMRQNAAASHMRPTSKPKMGWKNQLGSYSFHDGIFCFFFLFVFSSLFFFPLSFCFLNRFFLIFIFS